MNEQRIELSDEEREALEFAEADARHERYMNWWSSRRHALTMGARAKALARVLARSQPNPPGTYDQRSD